MFGLNRARSTADNAYRAIACEDIERTGETTHATRTQDGWWLISKHWAGVHSAYAVQTRLRKKYPTLAFRVLNTEAGNQHDAEIHAIRKIDRDRKAAANRE